MATVKINADLSASPTKVTIKGGETVTWEGDVDYAIHLPAPYQNPTIGHNGTKYTGTSKPFPAQAQVHTVHYTVTSGGNVVDPDIEIQP